MFGLKRDFDKASYIESIKTDIALLEERFAQKSNDPQSSYDLRMADRIIERKLSLMRTVQASDRLTTRLIETATGLISGLIGGLISGGAIKMFL